MTRVLGLIGVLIVFGATSLKSFAAGEESLTERREGDVTVYRIERPNVTQVVTDYHRVGFGAGDIVTINAGGCVQTGGSGRTWKRYVDPQGENSQHLYHGLIYLPGMRGLQRIEAVMRQREYRVPTGLPAGIAMYLKLGYEDDNYKDNGYYDRDDGTGDQCRAQPDAFVEIRIRRSR